MTQTRTRRGNTWRDSGTRQRGYHREEQALRLAHADACHGKTNSDRHVLPKHHCRVALLLDNDVILRDGWWNEAREYVKEERVGLIWGVEISELWEDKLAYIRARGGDLIDYSIQRFMIRGGLHDTMLRREALNGIILPPWLNVCEDAWVKLFVECKGFLWKIVKTGALAPVSA